MGARVYMVRENECFTQLRNVLSLNESFSTQITIKSMLHTIRQIWNVLEEPHMIEFMRSCFGHFVDLDNQWIIVPQKKFGFTRQFFH